MRMGLEAKTLPAIIFNAEVKRCLGRENAVDMIAVFVYMQHCSYNHVAEIALSKIAESLRVSTARVSKAIHALAEVELLRIVMKDGKEEGYTLQHIFNDDAVAKFEIIKIVKVEVKEKEKAERRDLTEEERALAEKFCEYLRKRFNYNTEKMIYQVAFYMRKLLNKANYADIEYNIDFLMKNYEREKFLPIVSSAREFESVYGKICAVANKYKVTTNRLEV